jgi:2-amino-4-hydroxy-6-hydroxymethyldihydropteridine diphosphokinase
MNKVYLLLGSNMGNSRELLKVAKQNIANRIGEIMEQSSLYQTAAWGFEHQPDFINQVIVAQTSLDARAVLDDILAIEKKMGRTRTTRNAPRTIDIDILFFNNEIYKEENLVVPHPALHQRRFVLVPLNELDPLLQHPVLEKTMVQLLAECPDSLGVKKI